MIRKLKQTMTAIKKVVIGIKAVNAPCNIKIESSDQDSSSKSHHASLPKSDQN